MSLIPKQQHGSASATLSIQALLENTSFYPVELDRLGIAPTPSLAICNYLSFSIDRFFHIQACGQCLRRDALRKIRIYLGRQHSIFGILIDLNLAIAFLLTFGDIAFLCRDSFLSILGLFLKSSPFDNRRSIAISGFDLRK
jgi:hypothetical protein